MTSETRTMSDAMLAATRAKPDWWSRVRACCKQVLHLARRPDRRLRLCEQLALGERRFVAVVEYEQSRFLVGGTAASLVLLAQLPPAASANEPGDRARKEQA